MGKITEDAALTFVFGMFAGAIIVFSIIVFNGYDRYRDGQIDAMTGKQRYCLTEQYVWTAGLPDDDLRCK